MKRRRFLPLPAAALAQSGRPWPDFVANDIVPYETPGITHGPMLGRPAASSMRVWLRTREPGPFRVLVSKSTPLSPGGTGVEGRTRSESDNTGHVDLNGLEPNTRYYYAVEIGGVLPDLRMERRSPWPSFRTLPDASSYRDPKFNPSGRFNFQFSIGCCADQHPTRSGGQYGNPPIFDTMLERHGDDLAFHVMNGDFIYEEARPPYTVEGSRSDYRLYLSRGRNMSRFYRHVPGQFVYDDHETWSDMEGAGEVGLKKGKWLSRDLALGPWYEYAGWANLLGPGHQPMRFGRARVRKGGDILADPRADFSTLRPGAVSTILVGEPHANGGVYGLAEVAGKNELRVRPAFTADEDVAYSVGAHHYYDYRVGNCHFLMLDARGERNLYIPEKVRDPDRFILGAAQEKWLKETVAASDADFFIVVSSVSWTIFHTDFHVSNKPRVAGRSPKEDGFTGALVERERLLAFFDGLRKPVLLFSGDLHNSFAVQITDNVWEFMVGPMNSAAHPRATAGYPPYGGWFDSEGRKVKIKWVAGFPDVHYSRLHAVYYAVVQVNNVLKSGRQEGPGLHWVAYESPQIVVRFHDGYTGELLYAEGISTVDSLSA